MKTEIEILELVYDLNDSTMETGATGKLVFESSGFCSCVRLNGETVWDDQDYGAPWDDEKDEQMPIREWFLQRITEITKEQSEMAEWMCRALRTNPAASSNVSGAPQGDKEA